MITLGIETSCDETALALIETETIIKPNTETNLDGNKSTIRYRVLAEVVHSQIALHEKYGGVFPMVAKREHAKMLVPLLKVLLEKYYDSKVEKRSNDLNNPNGPGDTEEKLKTINSLFGEKDADLYKEIEIGVLTGNIPVLKIDQIAVTIGPGLEPTLWVGLNFAKALSILWEKPIVPTNHMEGHLLSPLLGSLSHLTNLDNSNHDDWQEIIGVEYPAISLLVSGGHTEIIFVNGINEYQKIGYTVDDASGEAFDKIARMLGLSYPGGPTLSLLAEKARKSGVSEIIFPRPMLHSDNFNFSFSGLKTAVLYKIKEILDEKEKNGQQKELNDLEKMSIALGVENAIVDILVLKTKKAIEKYDAQTLLLGGGVSANKYLRSSIQKNIGEEMNIKVIFPSNKITGDNALMIAFTGAINKEKAVEGENIKKLRPDGNLDLV